MKTLIILLSIISFTFSNNKFEGKVLNITEITSPVLPFIISNIDGYEICIENNNNINVIKTNFDKRYKYIKPGYYISGYTINNTYYITKINTIKGNNK